MLTLKDVTPVRLIKNDFFIKINEAINNGATLEEQQAILGRGRAKRGMFEGDLDEGELEIGQVAGLINSIDSVDTIIKNIITEYKQALSELNNEKYLF